MPPAQFALQRGANWKCTVELTHHFSFLTGNILKQLGIWPSGLWSLRVEQCTNESAQNCEKPPNFSFCEKTSVQALIFSAWSMKAFLSLLCRLTSDCSLTTEYQRCKHFALAVGWEYTRKQPNILFKPGKVLRDLP